MNRPRGDKQRRVHFHAKRKRDARAASISKAVMDGFCEQFISSRASFTLFSTHLKKLAAGSAPIMPIVWDVPYTRNGMGTKQVLA